LEEVVVGEERLIGFGFLARMATFKTSGYYLAVKFVLLAEGRWHSFITTLDSYCARLVYAWLVGRRVHTWTRKAGFLFRSKEEDRELLSACKTLLGHKRYATIKKALGMLEKEGRSEVLDFLTTAAVEAMLSGDGGGYYAVEPFNLGSEVLVRVRAGEAACHCQWPRESSWPCAVDFALTWCIGKKFLGFIPTQGRFLFEPHQLDALFLSKLPQLSYTWDTLKAMKEALIKGDRLAAFRAACVHHPEE